MNKHMRIDCQLQWYGTSQMSSVVCSSISEFNNQLAGLRSNVEQTSKVYFQGWLSGSAQPRGGASEELFLKSDKKECY